MSAPILTTKDYMLLQGWLSEIEHGGSATEIRRKLQAATVVMPQDVEDDVVTVNSRVRFRLSGGPAYESILVAEADEDLAEATTLLDSPHGLALLGLRAGQSATVVLGDGSEDVIEVEAVLHQPEAERRARLMAVRTTGAVAGATA